MSFYIKLLIILAVCSISSAFVSNVYSIGPTQNHFSMFGQRCFDDKCTITSCFNDNPCQTTTDTNPSRSSTSPSFSSSPDDSDVEEGNNLGSFFDGILPW
jgi:hypothetical protein